MLILGIPTWDFGEIQEDWEAIWDQLDSLNLDGKIIAMYGMGDQFGYGEWFLDALGMLHDKLAPKGVPFIGYWPTEGYEFTSKKPIIADGQLFVGLALDETNQYDLSEERLEQLVRTDSGRNGRKISLRFNAASRHPAKNSGRVTRATRRAACCHAAATAASAARAGYAAPATRPTVASPAAVAPASAHRASTSHPCHPA